MEGYTEGVGESLAKASEGDRHAKMGSVPREEGRASAKALRLQLGVWGARGSIWLVGRVRKKSRAMTWNLEFVLCGMAVPRQI